MRKRLIEVIRRLTLLTQRFVLIVPIFTVVLVVTLQLNIDTGAIIAVELGDSIASFCENPNGTSSVLER